MPPASPWRRHRGSAASSIAALVAVWSLVAPGAALARTPDGGDDRPSIRPDQGPRVMALAAPWIDESEIQPGVRFAGARIEREVACYLVDGLRRLEACLVPPSAPATRPVYAVVALTDGVSLQLVAPPDPTESERALFAKLGDNIARNAAADAAAHDDEGGPTGLASLWRALPPTEPPVSLARPFAARAADPALWLLVVLCWLLWASRSAIAELPGRGWPWWALVLGLSAWTRLTLPVQAPMTAWSWKRITTIGEQLWLSPSVQDLLRLSAIEHLPFDDLQAIGARTLSIATPLALMGHARKLLGDARAAVAAGLLLAASPHAIRFAAADTQFNVSMFWSSLAFFWLYAALDARHLGRRLVYALGLVPLLVMALTARPLNVVVGPLMLTALWIAADREQLRWRVCLAAEVAAATVWAFWQFVDANASSLHELQHETSVAAVLGVFFSLDYNPLTFWRLTPPAWLLLIGLGAGALLRGSWPALARSVGQLRGAWLLAWALGYILLHGVIRPEEPLNHARYQLHSLPAMALLAAAGLLAWWRAWQDGSRWQRLSVMAAAALCLLAPWLHAPAIADVAFVTMQERAFLERLRPPEAANGGIPAGCTVLEVLRPSNLQRTSKIERVGRLALLQGGTAHLWTTANIQAWPDEGVEPSGLGAAAAGAAPLARPNATQDAGAVLANVGASVTAAMQRTREPRPDLAVLSARGRALLARPPACLAFYEGPECALAPGSSARHPACVEVLAAADWRLVAQKRHTTRIYDAPLVEHLRAPGDPLELRMWRRVGPPPSAMGR